MGCYIVTVAELELYHSRTCSLMTQKIVMMSINCNHEGLYSMSFRVQTTVYQNHIGDCKVELFLTLILLTWNIG